MNAGERTLVHVTPHPDDEALGCPGTLLTLQEHGWRIVNLLVGLGRDEQHERREAEAKAASMRAGYELVVAEPPARLGSTDDLAAAQTVLVQVVLRAIEEYSPAVVVTASPHDSHHGHEVVARATISAVAQLDDPPVLWMWGMWSDLAFPTIRATFDRRILELAKDVLREYGGEVDRNDYVRLLERRAEVNSILGAERVFGFGSQNAGGDYADLLTECIMTERGWELGSPRELLPAREPAGAPSGRPIGWWFQADSPQTEMHKRFNANRDSAPT
ncbi:PIG-L deacetylase family protein [Actinomycetota bacterium]